MGTKDIILLSASTVLSVLFIILFSLRGVSISLTRHRKQKTKKAAVCSVAFSWVFGSVFSVLIGESKGFAFDLNIFQPERIWL